MKENMKKLVLLRHGESIWNKENYFTGWTDVDLSSRGFEEAKNSGRLLREGNFTFDIAYTSVLKRAIRTLWITLDEMDRMWLPVNSSWRLNERHYGALQGLNKTETAAKYGEKQILIWRRSYDIRPPALDLNDPRHPRYEPQYGDLNKQDIPLTESLEDMTTRFLPYWNNTILPMVKSGQRVIIVAHGNSLRALVKHLDNISNLDILSLNIPTGIPLVYEFENDMTPIRHYYLGDQAKIKKASQIAKN